MANRGSAMKRLYKDLKELNDEPVSGCAASPLEDDLFVWYCNIIGTPGTPYEVVLIRVVLEFPDDYPSNPPKGFFLTDIEYMDGAQVTTKDGRIILCLDLFNNFRTAHENWGKDASGWSAAYSVKTVLVQLQGSMCDLFSTNPTNIEKARSSALEHVCDKTGHIGADRSKWWPLVPEEEEINILSKRLEKMKAPLDEIVCYATGATLSDGALFGYGIGVRKNGKLSSPFEYLSKNAFDSGIRTGTLNQPISFWLPLFINPDHYAKVKDCVKQLPKQIKGMKMLCRNGPAEVVFSTYASIMNAAVVEIMKTEGVTANDKFIEGYFNLFRLIIQLAEEAPGLRDLAKREVAKFVNDPKNRSKTLVPDLGEWLIWLILAPQTWTGVATAYLCEVECRNVLWYCFERHAAHRELSVIKEGQKRSEKVFDATVVSRHLISFQVRLLSLAKEFDMSWTSPPEELKQKIKDLFKEVSKQGTWDDYYRTLRLLCPTERERTQQLEQALHLSKAQGYTK
jgi:ubiquitin-protein ligase